MDEFELKTGSKQVKVNGLRGLVAFALWVIVDALAGPHWWVWLDRAWAVAEWFMRLH